MILRDLLSYKGSLMLPWLIATQIASTIQPIFLICFNFAQICTDAVTVVLYDICHLIESTLKLT